VPQRPIEERDAVAPRAKQPDAAVAARVRFRVGGDADVPAVVPLINEAYLREAWLLPPPRTTVDDLREELLTPGAALLIAEVDGALAGCVRIKQRERDTYFGLLAVAPAQQGRGLASLIVAKVEEIARRAGSEAVRLDCAKENKLPPLYESMGYIVEREETDAYYGKKGPITVSHMKKDLR
jgi:ribosomal protein S18 acetylase RimI-like enzyme